MEARDTFVEFCTTLCTRLKTTKDGRRMANHIFGATWGLPPNGEQDGPSDQITSGGGENLDRYAQSHHRDRARRPAHNLSR